MNVFWSKFFKVIRKYYILILVIVNLLSYAITASSLVILLTVNVLMSILVYKVMNEWDTSIGEVKVDLIVGEYGIGKTTYVENEYKNKKTLFINLYEESSKGNFLKDLYYKKLNIYISAIILALLFYIVEKNQNSNMLLVLSIGIYIFIEYFVYLINFFTKNLILENKFYLESVVLYFSRYDTVVFDDLDRLSYEEQNEFLKLISYLKKNMNGNQKIVCVGNLKNIDKIFLDKFINNKVIIDKQQHVQEWINFAIELGYDKYMDLYEELLNLFLPQINFRYMIKFKEYLQNNTEENIINNFIIYYIKYYIDIDIRSEEEIFKNEFTLSEIEPIFGEFKQINSGYFEATAFTKVKQLIEAYNVNDEFYFLCFRNREFMKLGLMDNSYIFKIICQGEKSETILKDEMAHGKPATTELGRTYTEMIYCYVSKENIALIEYIHKLDNTIARIEPNLLSTNFEIRKAAIEKILKDEKQLPEVNQDVVLEYVEELKKHSSEIYPQIHY